MKHKFNYFALGGALAKDLLSGPRRLFNYIAQSETNRLDITAHRALKDSWQNKFFSSGLSLMTLGTQATLGAGVAAIGATSAGVGAMSAAFVLGGAGGVFLTTPLTLKLWTHFYKSVKNIAPDFQYQSAEALPETNKLLKNTPS